MIKELLRFENFPWILRQAVVAVVGWRWSRRRYGEVYKRELRFLERTRAVSPEVRRRLQRYRLHRMIDYSRSFVPYYSATVPSHGGDALNDLKAIPVLDKETLKKQPRQVTSRVARKGKSSSTSGTSGKPMVVEHSPESEQRRFAYLADHKKLCGVAPRARSVRLSGRIIANPAHEQRRPWLHVPSEGQLLLSTYHLNNAHRHVIAQKLRRYRPSVIDGYPSAILSLLHLMDGKKAWREFLQIIIVTAETLTPEMRRQIEDLSGAPVVNYYSASEGNPFIQQCLYGTYHVRWQSGYFEVETPTGISDEGTGELIVTSFTQDRMPLVRYRTGDYVQDLRESGSKICSCGEITPTVEQIIGRVEEMVTTRHGQSLGMFSYRTLKEISGIKQAQIIQNSIQDFSVRVVLEDGFDLEVIQENLVAKFSQVLGYEVTVELEPVEEIPKGANGKTRLVINNVD